MVIKRSNFLIDFILVDFSMDLCKNNSVIENTSQLYVYIKRANGLQN